MGQNGDIRDRPLLHLLRASNEPFTTNNPSKLARFS